MQVGVSTAPSYCCMRGAARLQSMCGAACLQSYFLTEPRSTPVVKCQWADLCPIKPATTGSKWCAERSSKSFWGDPELSNDLVVAASTARNFVPSLLLWLKRAQHLKCFEALDQGSHQEVIIGALVNQAPELKQTYLTDPSANALSGLAQPGAV